MGSSFNKKKKRKKKIFALNMKTTIIDLFNFHLYRKSSYEIGVRKRWIQHKESKDHGKACGWKLTSSFFVCPCGWWWSCHPQNSLNDFEVTSGFKVEVAEDEKDAVDCSSAGANFHIVFIDIQMPAQCFLSKDLCMIYYNLVLSFLLYIK